VSTSRFSRYTFHREPNWRSHNAIRAGEMPGSLRHWLLDRGSLTQRLIIASGNRFRVEVIKQRWEVPRLSESSFLNLGHRQLALVREVILYGADTPWVYARSILPMSSLTGRLRKLRHLDNRPLGALLFADPNMVRGNMEVACFYPQNTKFPDQLEAIKKPVWGRRSLFYLDSKPLLVSEIFLPGFNPGAC